jgi:ribosomal protein L4
MTKKQRKLALLGAFVTKLENKEVVIVDGIQQLISQQNEHISLLKTLAYSEE